jgi:hypothetical protein
MKQPARQALRGFAALYSRYNCPIISIKAANMAANAALATWWASIISPSLLQNPTGAVPRPFSAFAIDFVLPAADLKMTMATRLSGPGNRPTVYLVGSKDAVATKPLSGLLIDGGLG